MFSGEAAVTVTEGTWHHTQKIRKNKDGSIVMTFKVDGLNEIVAASDGVMVARGDLGVETDVAEMPMAQVAATMLARSDLLPPDMDPSPEATYVWTAAGRTPADETIEGWNGPWHGEVAPLIANSAIEGSVDVP